MRENWRIDELSTRVAKALESATYEQESARVREVPDVRTIRYYTTLGLLDKPLEMRGRVAYYGRRHLLQLVAVKRLQAQGKSLVEAQQALLGASDDKLLEVAGLSAEVLKAATNEPLEVPTPAGGVVAPTPARPQRFWAQAPEWSPPAAPVPAVVLPVDASVSLVLQGIAPSQLTEEVLASLQPAVRLLREALTRAGLGHSGVAAPLSSHGPNQETAE